MTSSAYRWPWPKLAKQVLAEAGYRCEVEGCGNRAVSVDHIVPFSEAPELRLVRSNLRATCSRCNYGRVSGRAAELAAALRRKDRPTSRRVW